jgi:hypothetical protein
MKTTLKKGVAPPTHSRSARCRSLGASSQKFAEKTKFQKVLVKDTSLENIKRLIKEEINGN